MTMSSINWTRMERFQAGIPVSFSDPELGQNHYQRLDVTRSKHVGAVIRLRPNEKIPQISGQHLAS